MVQQEQRTELRFVGQIAGVKIASPKANTNSYYGNSIDGGHLEVTFKIERPKAPRKPQPHYAIQNGPPKPFTKPEPKPKKGDAEGAFEQRLDRWQADKAANEQATARYAEHVADHQAALAQFEAVARDYGVQLMQYSNIVGIAAALGDVKCAVAIAPAVQDMLPGFTMTANLLDTPDPEEAAVEDDDFDESFEGDDVEEDED